MKLLILMSLCTGRTEETQPLRWTVLWTVLLWTVLLTQPLELQKGDSLDQLPLLATV